MKTLLIAEDEKLIRAGIKTMVQRSGVEVGEILEAGNGEAAWEILTSRPVDAVFTDIRMPRMDGVELVQRIHGMENPPMVVAISGYDDFSYAVEMLRNGVMEYLLKPVERDKIQKALTDINDKLARQSNESRLALYERIIRERSYRILSISLGQSLPEQEGVVRLPEQADAVYYIVEESAADSYIEEAAYLGSMGESGVHTGSGEVESAYTEARIARQIGFLRDLELYSYRIEDGTGIGQEGVLAADNALLLEQSRTKRVQLVGTEKHKEMADSYEQLFAAVATGEISYRDFEAEMKETLRMLQKIYRNLFTESAMHTQIARLESPLEFENLSSYREALFEFLLALSNQSRVQDVTEPTRRKMEAAVEFIKENFRSDLNMAVVSNYISMNYSLFSYAFKQYTGQNFVNFLKDIRLQEARRLLTQTDDKIIDIASSVGYDNYKHFLKLFRMEYGVSPTEYRNNMKK